MRAPAMESPTGAGLLTVRPSAPPRWLRSCVTEWQWSTSRDKAEPFPF
jgi:hypothetical protein